MVFLLLPTEGLYNLQVKMPACRLVSEKWFCSSYNNRLYFFSLQRSLKMHILASKLGKEMQRGETQGSSWHVIMNNVVKLSGSSESDRHDLVLTLCFLNRDVKNDSWILPCAWFCCLSLMRHVYESLEIVHSRQSKTRKVFPPSLVFCKVGELAVYTHS